MSPARHVTVAAPCLLDLTEEQIGRGLHLVWVFYDIPDDPRRHRLHGILEGYGVPLQKSVFQCALRDRELRELVGELRRAADPAEDSIVVAKLCRGCGRATTVLGSVEREVWPDFYLA